jgi:hypothetical protein
MFLREDHELARLHGVYIQVKLLARFQYEAMEVLSETRVMPSILSGIECTAVYAD